VYIFHCIIHVLLLFGINKMHLAISTVVLNCSGIELRGFVNARTSVRNTRLSHFAFLKSLLPRLCFARLLEVPSPKYSLSRFSFRTHAFAFLYRVQPKLLCYSCRISKQPKPRPNTFCPSISFCYHEATKTVKYVDTTE